MAIEREEAAVHKFAALNKRAISEESTQRGVNFTPRAGDTFVVTSDKCGTTWMQQIVQSLRTRGDMNFEEITLAMPCLEMAWDYGYGDLQSEQKGCVRAFKTHLAKPACPWSDACKYIYVAREPLHAAVSYYHFMEDWQFQQGEISVDTFMKRFYLRDTRSADERPGRVNVWDHFVSWYPYRHRDNVLWLHYEDMRQDIDKCIKMVANFLDIPLDDELFAIVKEQSSIGFMAEHRSKYDEHPLKTHINTRCGLPARAGLDGANQGKVRTKPKATPSPDVVALMQEKWTEAVQPVTGCATYTEFRHSNNLELKHSFGV